MAKRAMDLVVAAGGLLVFGLPMLLIALAIKLDSPGPVFFRQERVGRWGRPFRIHKFRTMSDVAPAVDAAGPQLTVAGDARITRVGRWLRQRRFDELPQLIDVLAGTMSAVGPRPEVPRYVALYPAAARERLLALKPGLTDPAALAFRDEGEQLAAAADPEREYVDVILPQKIAAALAYAERATVWTDCRLLLRSLKVLATG